MPTNAFKTLKMLSSKNTCKPGGVGLQPCPKPTSPDGPVRSLTIPVILDAAKLKVVMLSECSRAQDTASSPMGRLFAALYKSDSRAS